MINITVIGFGCVGSSLSLLLLHSKHAIRLNIMDPDPSCAGAFLDLAHGLHLYSDKEMHLNNRALFIDADFVYYSAGVPNVHGASRLSTVKQNNTLTKQIFEDITFSNHPYVIVITNPVDIITKAVQQYSGLPAERVIGTGTFLDSIRLSYYLSTLTDYRVSDINAMVLGEHGDSQVPIYSLSKIEGKPLLNNKAFTNNILSEATQLTKNAAFQIRKTQDGTTYGVSKCAEVLLDYFLGKNSQQLSLSVLTNDHYRNLLNLDQDIYISLPVQIEKGKIKIMNNFSYSAEELNALRKSARILTEAVKA